MSESELHALAQQLQQALHLALDCLTQQVA